jgi:hypothetical protein
MPSFHHHHQRQHHHHSHYHSTTTISIIGIVTIIITIIIIIIVVIVSLLSRNPAQVGLAVFIPDVPTAVEIQLKRQEHITGKVSQPSGTPSSISPVMSRHQAYADLLGSEQRRMMKRGLGVMVVLPCVTGLRECAGR